MKLGSVLSAALMWTAAVAPLAAAQSEIYSSKLWSGLHYRMIGPYRGGRVTAVTGVPSEPYTFYMGSTGGGVWKTTDAGHTFVNISDRFFSVASIGAVSVALSNPNIVYVGTGSSKIRSNVSIGQRHVQVHRCGQNLELTSGCETLARSPPCASTPTNPDIVYVAAQGNPVQVPDTESRCLSAPPMAARPGKIVFHLSDTAGAADLEIQPGHPNVLFACMWHGQRKPWTIISGAMEGGIYKSTDSGDNWTKLGNGLPNELFGRSNVAISDANPDRIYALIEAKPGSGLYRSDDAGATMEARQSLHGSSSHAPFYYTTLGVDPEQPGRSLDWRRRLVQEHRWR